MGPDDMQADEPGRPARGHFVHTVDARGGVAALVVTYNPGRDVVQRIDAIAPQVARLIVVDNGSSGPATDDIRKRVAESDGTFIANERNLGIATALNQGARAAASGGARWL